MATAELNRGPAFITRGTAHPLGLAARVSSAPLSPLRNPSRALLRIILFKYVHIVSGELFPSPFQTEHMLHLFSVCEF